MFYIHQATCISPQQTFGNINIDQLNETADNKLQVVEPSYEGIPAGILRRMGKAVRIGVGAALPILRTTAPDGIIIGTANGGMEDCIKFLNQIIDYDEGMLTPTNFVQSTPNAIAAQLGLLGSNKGYNITHVHRGLSFENAVIDAVMMLKENPTHHYLLGAVDEISGYNYNIEWLGGWYKKDPILANQLYESNTAGSIAGEGAAMFLANMVKTNAIAQLQAIHISHTADEAVVADQLKKFISQQLPAGEKIDLLMTGENGDSRMLKYYTACEAVVGKDIAVARFKHMMGEYTSASATAAWLACQIVKQQTISTHMLKYPSSQTAYRRILIYNNYKGLQHSFILVNKTS
jgi:Beta-ketoacyl synthase, N-terminal domain